MEGKVTLSYTGLEAMKYRLEERNEDDIARKKSLEDALREEIPGTAEVELTNNPDWASSEMPLVAELSVKFSGWASRAGKRTLLPVGIFSAREQHIFEHTNRTYPIYFEYPYQEVDDIAVQLPVDWQVSSVPPPQSEDKHTVAYKLNVEANNGALHLTRELDINVLALDQKSYPALRNFFQKVRTGDEQQIILQPALPTTSN